MTTTALTPSQQLRAAEQDERNERIDAHLNEWSARIAQAAVSTNRGLVTPDALRETASLLIDLEQVGLLRRRGDVEHVSERFLSLATAIQMLDLVS